MKKIKQTYFSHDSNARNDIKLIKLRSKYGYEGYGIYFALIELLFSEGNKLCTSHYDILAYGLQCDPTILKQVIEEFDLFVIEDDCFYSIRLDNVINEIESKSKKASDNAKKRWNGNATVMQPHSEGSAIKLNEIKLNEIKSNNINKRLVDFKKSIQSIEGISDEDKKDFYLYWTEKNKSGNKFRAEMEKTFDISRRINRWVNNGFNKQKSKFPDHYDEYTYKKLDPETRKEYEEHLKSLGYMCKYSPSAGMVWNKIKK